MRLIIQPDYQSVSLWAAHYVAAKINYLIHCFNDLSSNGPPWHVPDFRTGYKSGLS